ncbi:PP2C family protein-serine/threonine phosphatase [Actinomycetospora cinnamomea]|uniref:Serine phosphatase RsbU (Regulator of sigma subunit) n=1 Tax=Actinomycetospora cinnamomea TaxID=663609 RepID=A0A2U1ECY7_9PSEU|nr:SpoIIE family protein phosphatase [Actinomycetospora cinnamomea]PVY97735.1 serine phosphatase RsbU (regulator of sigma subunit) [Actinomycetospora cinnamomea]
MEPVEPDASAPLRVLLVEDDDADALLVTEHFADAALTVDLHRARSLAEAEESLVDPDGPDCVLLDLALPDAHDFEGLRRLLRAEGPAVLVLTGRRDEQLGADAVSVGAQDYLVKDAVDGPTLARAVRYAVERRRADRVRRALRDAHLRADENARLERGLLPTPLLADPALRIIARYEPGTEQTLLGGDFYDVVEGADGTLHAVIGDVCGHGPDEAALGVSLRIAWRTLVLSGIDPDRVLPTMHELLVHERNNRALFTTLATATVEPDRTRMTLRLAGHPPPALIGEGDDTRMLSDARLGMPLGVGAGSAWAPLEVELPPKWTLLLYTDGLIEGRQPAGDVLWTDGLMDLLREVTAGPEPWRDDPGVMLDGVMERVRSLSTAQTDDVAAVLLVCDR